MSTPSYPMSSTEIVHSLPSCELLGASLGTSSLEGLDLGEATRRVTRSDVDDLAKQYDWTKKEITEENFAEYQAWLKWRLVSRSKATRGSKHYKTRRLKFRLQNYKYDKQLKKLQQAYRDTIYGKWVFKKKLCKARGVGFNVTLDEYRSWLLGVGNIPDTGIPYWKMTCKHPKHSFRVERIDKSKPYQTDNVKFTYKGEFICNAVDLFSISIARSQESS